MKKILIVIAVMMIVGSAWAGSNPWKKPVGPVDTLSVTGDLTVGGSATAPRYNITLGSSNTVVGSATTGANIDTGTRLTLLGTATAQNLTSGIADTCIGRLSCEVVTTGSFNIMLAGYSGADTVSGDGNTQVGGHSALTGADSSFNSMFGFQSGGAGYYPDNALYDGQYNTFMGANTGFLWTTTMSGASYGHFSDYVTLVGAGASAGTGKWIAVSGRSGSGTSAVTITSTAHGFSAGDFVSFRDFKPEIILGEAQMCALAPSGSGAIGYYKVAATNLTANAFELQWCRSADGTTSNWSGQTCSAWNTAQYNASVAQGSDVINFSSCATHATGAWVHELMPSYGDYEFLTVIGSNAVGNRSNAVFLGRDTDTVVIGGTTTPITIADTTIGLDISAGVTILGADIGTNKRTDGGVKLALITGAHKLCCDGTGDEEPVHIISYRTSTVNSIIDIGGESGGSTGDVNAVQQIRFTTAANYTTLYGTERMRIDSAGNVGIGTTAPTSKLHMQAATAGAFNALSINNSVGAERVRLSYDTDNIKLGIAVGATVTTPQVTLDGSGNVGIGTVTPTANLEVEASANPFISIVDTGTGALSLARDANAYFAWNNGDLYFKYGGTWNAHPSGSGTTALTIKSDGRVGIGTITPTSPLQVVGIPTHADNAAAVTGGLTAGAFYQVTGSNPRQLAVVY